MKRLLLLGLSNPEKTNLMLYMAKSILAINNKKVAIATSNKQLMGEFNPYEYIENLDIFYYQDINEVKQVSYGPYVAVIYDIEKIIPSDVMKEIFVNSTIYVTSTQRKFDVDFNKDLIKKINTSEVKLDFNAFFMNMLPLSKIKERILSDRLAVETGFEKIEVLPFNIHDMSVIMDNEYNKSLAIKYLSHDYKRCLVNVYLKLFGITDVKEIKKITKRIERSN